MTRLLLTLAAVTLVVLGLWMTMLPDPLRVAGWWELTSGIWLLIRLRKEGFRWK